MMNRSRTLLCLGLLAVVLVAGACGSLRGERTGIAVELDDRLEAEQLRREQVPDDLALAGAIAVSGDEPAPQPFEFQAVDLFTASTVEGTSVFEERPAVVVFTTPWCPVCVAEAPEIARFAGENPDVAFVMVHTGGTQDEFRAFVTEAGLDDVPVLHLDDPDGGLWARFGVISQPTWVLVDSEGRVRQSVGALQEDGLERAIELVRNGMA